MTTKKKAVELIKDLIYSSHRSTLDIENVVDTIFIENSRCTMCGCKFKATSFTALVDDRICSSKCLDDYNKEHSIK